MGRRSPRALGGSSGACQHSRSGDLSPPSLRLGVELCRDPSPDAGKPRWLSVLELGTRVVQPPSALPGTVTGRPRFPPPHSRLGVGGSALPNIF